MSQEVKFYRVGARGVQFGGILTNVDNPDMDIDKTLDGTDMVYVIFKNPRGKLVKKPGTIIDRENDDDPTNDTEIIYQDTNDPSVESILDIAGLWEYYITAQFINGDYIVTPFAETFWVVA